MNYQEYFDARKQEGAAACRAAMMLYGVEMSIEEICEAAEGGAGEFSQYTILDSVAAFFRAANQAESP